MGIERDRLDPDDPARRAVWRTWGPYVAAREWGNPREDYSADADPWRSFTYDDARSRAYRWGEDGLAGVCDARQTICVGLAVWNGRDPHLKERLFGLTGPQGNHGEDVKEYWWHLDATPTSSWLRWRYHYPRSVFPVDELLAENQRRSFDDPEFELIDTGVFEAGYWDIDVSYAKQTPTELGMRIRVRNVSGEADTLHVLPTVWFRNTWRWNDSARPELRAAGGGLVEVDHHRLPAAVRFGAAPDGAPARLLFCENETNLARLYGAEAITPHPKDGIDDHVVGGVPDSVSPRGTGTKVAGWYTVPMEPGTDAELHVRWAETTDDPSPALDLGAGFDALFEQREREADEFFAELTPSGATADEAAVLRQAMAGLLWTKQYYRFDVNRWLDGDPAMPPPPPGRTSGRNAGWRHVEVADVLCMPDAWEYPWFAAWDLAFHCIPLAHLDPELAKQQLLLLLREWYTHPNGQLPAYEWSFGDVNPPVHAWAALRVFEIDGRRDLQFLQRVFQKLLINFTWWVNRKDGEGNNVFEGGFLGLDNIGPFNRSEQLPVGGVLEQSDATGWMAMYCLNLLEMAIILAGHEPAYQDMAIKFLEHFALISSSMNDVGLWDEEDGFYYDIVRTPGGDTVPVRVRSMVGLIPLFAMAVFHADEGAGLDDFARRADWFLRHRPRLASSIGRMHPSPVGAASLVSVVSPERLRRVLRTVLDEDEFLSPHGLRSLSKIHEKEPGVLEVEGYRATVDYEPAESRSGLFGGNSNWRGPVWFPLNFLIIEALRRYHGYLGDDFTVEYPTGSGSMHSLAEVADGLSDRLVSLFLDDSDGHRPVFGATEVFQTDAAWHGLIPFHEYFHGDTGAGLGASHQTGWTSLVADLITSRRWVPHGRPPPPDPQRD